MATDEDREQYDRAAARHPTVFHLNRAAAQAAQHTWTPACDGLHQPGSCPERTDLAERLFGPDPEYLLGRWIVANGGPRWFPEPEK